MSVDKKILIIDDEPDIVEILEDLLSMHYSTLHSSKTAEDGIKNIDNNIYDCIILDLNINNTNGKKNNHIDRVKTVNSIKNTCRLQYDVSYL